MENSESTKTVEFSNDPIIRCVQELNIKYKNSEFKKLSRPGYFVDEIIFNYCTRANNIGGKYLVGFRKG